MLVQQRLSSDLPVRLFSVPHLVFLSPIACFARRFRRHPARPLVAAAFGLDGWFGGFFGRVLVLVCGVVGGLLVPRFFDLFVIGASAVSGAAMVMTGANHILRGVGFFDRAAGGVCRRC